LERSKLAKLLEDVRYLSRVPARLSQVVAQEVLWQESVQQCLDRLLSDFSPNYDDVTKGIASAVLAIKHGMRLLLKSRLDCLPLRHSLPLDVQKAQMFSDETMARTKGEASKCLQQLIQGLLKFPVSLEETQETIALLLEERSFETIAILLKVNEEKLGHFLVDVKQLFLMLLRCALYKIVLHILSVGKIERASFQIVDRLFVVAVNRFHRAEQEDEEKENEKAAFFKYKTREHKIETEEEREVRRMKELFPDFSGDYADLIVPTVEMEIEQSKAKEKEKPVDPADGIASLEHQRLSPEDINQICHMHKTLFGYFRSVFYYRSKESLENEQVKVLKLSVETSAEIMKVLAFETDLQLDEKSHSSHVIIAAERLNNLKFIERRIVEEEQEQRRMPESEEVEEKIALLKKKKTTKTTLHFLKQDSSLFSSNKFVFNPNVVENFYTKVDLMETGLVYAPLQKFLARVDALLLEFPENTTLLESHKIILKITTFPCASPVMKIMTGLDLLLTVADVWETTSPQRYSLALNINEIVSLVARWRRLELESWPFILRAKEEEFQARARAWWFKLYSAFNISAVDNLEESHKLLEHFVESSNYGEFVTRVAMIGGFYHQILLEREAGYERTNRTNEVSAQFAHYLYNVYQYYSQFFPKLEKLIENERANLEKQLKDTLKLGYWDNRTYRKMKDSVVTSHRAISKVSKELEVILQKPVIEIFNFDVANEFEHQAFSYDLSIRNPSHFLIKPPAALLLPLDADAHFLQFVPEDEKPKLVRLPKIAKKVHSFCAGFVPSMLGHGQEESKRLSDVSGFVISQITELSKDTEKKSKPLKKRALLDLLSYLGQMGLHFREMFINREQYNVSFLMSRPVCDQTLFAPESESSPFLVQAAKIWRSADQYYYKNISLLLKLRQARLKAHKDLSKLEVHKILNYNENMLTVALKEREEWRETFAGYLNLRDCVHSLDDFAIDDKSTIDSDALFSQRSIHENISRLKVQCDSLTGGLDGACLHVKYSESKLPLEGLRARAVQAKETMDALSARLGRPSPCLVGAKTLRSVSKVYSELSSLKEQLNTRILDRPEAQSDAFLVHLSELCDPIFAQVSTLFETYTRLTSLSPTPLSGQENSSVVEFMTIFSESLSGSVLQIQLATQSAKSTADQLKLEKETLAKRDDNAHENASEAMEVEKEKEPVGTVEKPNQQELDAINVAKVFDRYAQAFKSFHLPKLAANLSAMTQYIARLSSDPQIFQNAPLVRLLSNFLALAHLLTRQALGLLESSMLQFLEFHREFEKLHYVLLVSSNRLFANGFCIKEPEEEQEEGSDLDDSDDEIKGMGEGEGKKDVSDQIENEEQAMGEKYDEPQKPESKEKPENKPVKPDEGVEMENDFDGEMHDLEAQEEQESDEAEESEKEDEMERQLGDVDQQEELLDEKLWDDEEESEQEKDERESEKKETTDIENNQPRDKDITAKENEDENEGPEDKSERKKEEKDDQQDGASGEEKESSDEGEDEEEGQGYDYDNAFDENRFQPPEPEEEFKIPEDLNLDGGEEMEEEKPDEGDGEGEEENFDLPPEEIEPEKKQEPEASPEEDEGDGRLEDAKQAEGEEGEEEKAGEEKDGEEKPDAAPEQNPEDEQERQSDAFGIKDETGKPTPNMQSMAQDNEAHNESEQQPNQQEKSQSAEQQADEEKAQTSRMQADQQTDQQEELKKNEANPQRSLGDAKKQWERRLKADDIKKMSEEEKQKDKEDPDGEDEIDGKRAQYEFVKDSEQEDAQTLANATEEQLKAFQDQDEFLDNEKEKHAEEEALEETKKDNEHEAEGEEEQESNNATNLKPSKLMNKVDKQNEIGTEAEGMLDIEKEEKMDVEDSKEKQNYDIISSSKSIAETSLIEEKFQELSEEDLLKMRFELSTLMATWQRDEKNMQVGLEIWKRLQRITAALSHDLCEQLRLLLGMLAYVMSGFFGRIFLLSIYFSFFLSFFPL
jgi:midasin